MLRQGLSPLVLMFQLTLGVPSTTFRAVMAINVLLLDADLHCFEAAMLQEHLVQLFACKS